MEIESLDAGAALTREMDMLAAVSEAPFERRFWVWQSPQALVAPKKMASLPGFEAVADQMAVRSWPVHLRATGGDVTPQGAGIVNVTHVYSINRARDFSIEAEYDRLCAPIEAVLGAGASRGWSPGAFCDGAYNVQLHGKKFAGTAMRFRPAKGDRSRMAVMAHALMLMSPLTEPPVSALNAFLGGLGETRRIDLSAHSSQEIDAAPFCERLFEAFEALRPDPMRLD